MRLPKHFAVTAMTCLLSAGVVTVACSKSDDGDTAKTTLTDTQKTDANKAAAAAAGKVGDSASGAGLRGQSFRSEIRRIYNEAKFARQQSAKVGLTSMLDDGDLDICSYFDTSCQESLNKDMPVDESGSTCKYTSCTNGTTLNCTDADQSAVCGDVTYKFTNSVSNSVMACTRAADASYTLSIKANVSGSVSGGSLVTPVGLACKVALDMSLSGAASDGSDNSGELSCDAGQFSCAVNGVELSCAEIKALVDANSCE